MIKYKVKIIYRDDTEEVFSCVDYPNFSLNDFIAIYLTTTERKYLIRESIKLVEVKEYWSSK